MMKFNEYINAYFGRERYYELIKNQDWVSMESLVSEYANKLMEPYSELKIPEGKYSAHEMINISLYGTKEKPKDYKHPDYIRFDHIVGLMEAYAKQKKL